MLGENIRRLIKIRSTSQEEVAKKADITQVALHKIITGKTKKTGSLVEIARALGVTAEILVSRPIEVQEGKTDHNNPNNFELYHGKLGKLPLISFIQAGSWDEAMDPYELNDVEEWLYSPIPAGPRGFLVRNRGLSMHNGQEDGYPDGAILVMDPDVEADHDSDVIARTPEGKTTFKRLQIDQDGKHLLALNPSWPTRIIHIPEDTVIIAVCVGHWIDRRKMAKAN